MADSIQLIGIGRVVASRADALKPGDRVTMNYGYTYTLKNVQPKGKHHLLMKFVNDNTGIESEVTRKKETLFGTPKIKNPGVEQFKPKSMRRKRPL